MKINAKYRKQAKSNEIKVNGQLLWNRGALDFMKANNITKHPTKVIGENLIWEFKGPNFTARLELYINSPKQVRLGQLSVRVEGVKLKQQYEMLNYNNIGESPLENRWDKDSNYTNVIGEIAKIELCEYGVGDGGMVRIGKFYANIQKEEAANALAKYRAIIEKELYFRADTLDGSYKCLFH